MHQIQYKLLRLLKTGSFKKGNFRDLARLIGETHPFKVSYHLDKLEKEGFVKRSKDNSLIVVRAIKNLNNNSFISLPVVSSASCGNPEMIAEQDYTGHIKISKNIFRVNDPQNYIVIKAVGNSMNKAKINGKQNIEDGDYVIVDLKKMYLRDLNRKYVLAVIDECATIKKLTINDRDGVIALTPESTENHPAIFLDQQDEPVIRGIVKYVVKKPIMNWSD